MARQRFWAAVGAILTLGCADLSDLDAGVCGNGIVDPGEDCDTATGGCGVPDTAAECRFVCETNADCPGVQTCGIDSICRKHSGTFAQGANLLQTGQLIDVRMGDIDADALDDLVSIDVSGKLVVNYLGADGVTGTAGFQTTPLSVAVGQMTDGDSRADIVHLPEARVGVLRSLTGRTLEPTAYSPIPVNQLDARFFVLEGRRATDPNGKDAFFEGQEILQMSGTTIQSVIDGDKVLFDVGYNSSEVIPLDRAIPSGNIDTRPISPCDEFVLTKSGHDRINVYTACKPFGLGWNDDPATLAPIMMPAGATTGEGLMIVDINGDGHLDVLVTGPVYENTSGLPGQPDFVMDAYAALGVGDGTFIDGEGGINVARLIYTGLGAMPLAGGDLNGDTIADFVLPQGLALSTGCATLAPTCWVPVAVQQADWYRAVVADFNGNGLLDIAAISYFGNYVSFLNGTGTGLFNTYQVPTEGPPGQLEVGDFDGDLVLDIAVSEGDTSVTTGVGAKEGAVESNSAHDSVSIMFGKLQGAPEPPVSMGKLNRILAVAAGHFFFQGAADATSDLGVLSQDDITGIRNVALFTGATNRQLQSPFLLSNAADQQDGALDVVVGKFTGEDHADVAVFSMHAQGGGSPPFKTRLWMLESTGEAQLAESTAVPSSEYLDARDVDTCSLTMIPVDLDGNGTQALVILGRPKAKDGPGGRILVARAEGNSWQLGQVVETEQVFQNGLTQRFVCKAFRTGDMNPTPDLEDFERRSPYQVVDLEGAAEGALELVVLTATSDDKKRLSVFPIGPDMGQTFYDLTLPDTVAPSSFLALQADADPELELVLVTDFAVYLAQLDLGAHAIAKAELIAGSDVEQPIPVDRGAPSGGPGLIGYFNYSLGTFGGDFNGDNMTDFAIVRDTTIDLFLAKAVRP
jgi:hypothetical protein